MNSYSISVYAVISGLDSNTAFDKAFPPVSGKYFRTAHCIVSL